MVGVLLEFYRPYVITIGLSTTFETKSWKALAALVLIVGLYIVLAGRLGTALGGA